jgi:hypothetical protein
MPAPRESVESRVALATAGRQRAAKFRQGKKQIQYFPDPGAMRKIKARRKSSSSLSAAINSLLARVTDSEGGECD